MNWLYLCFGDQEQHNTVFSGPDIVGRANQTRDSGSRDWTKSKVNWQGTRLPRLSRVHEKGRRRDDSNDWTAHTSHKSI